jgi:hypothetical protein
MKGLLNQSDRLEIIIDSNPLTPKHRRQWGVMDEAQMLASSQKPLGASTHES